MSKRKSVAITAAIIAFCVALPAIAKSKPRAASLSTTITMEVGDQVQVDEADLTIILDDLSYVRCPADAICIRADGPVVRYQVIQTSTQEVLHKGFSNYGAPNRYPYFVLRMDSDGETFAKFSVHRTTDWCSTRSSRVDEYNCWTTVASMSKTADYCNRIRSIEDMRLGCLERMAEELSQASLCLSVDGNRGWCGFLRATGSVIDPRSCASLLKIAHRQSCFETAARQYQSDEFCSVLDKESDRQLCLKSAASTE